ncbi:unnamed protein product, partial [Prorocentrum cordatum]
MQQRIMEHVRDSVGALGAPPAGVDTSETLRRLRAPGFYGSDEGVKLGNYNPELPSLPSVGSHAVPLADLRGAGGRRRVADNVWLREPDNVALCTGETLGSLEVGEDETLYISEADLSIAFYHLQLPVELRNLFTLRRVRARDIGLTEIDGVPYVDNFVATSIVTSEVHRLASAVVEGFREAGWVVAADVDSPGEDLARDRAVLGWDISCR